MEEAVREPRLRPLDSSTRRRIHLNGEISFRQVIPCEIHRKALKEHT